MSSPPAAEIRGITFDVGDTLIRAAPSVGVIYSRVCRDHGVRLDPDECNGVFEEVWRERSVERARGADRFTASDRGEEGYWEDLVREIMGRCSVAPGDIPPISAFREAFASPESWRIYDEVPAALGELGGNGYRLAVLSNWDSQLPRLLQRLRLRHHFSHVFVSALAGVEKPHEGFFAMAAEQMDLPRSSVLHIGDRLREDYHGARRAGMQALWLDRRGNGHAAGDSVDRSHVIGDLTGAVSWLAAS